MTEDPKGTAIVTGAAGFLGRHVVAAFARAGWRVAGIGHGDLSDAAALGLIHWQAGTVDAASMAKLVQRVGAPDVVLHCAGGSSVGVAASAPLKDFHRTVASIAAVVETIRTLAPAARLVLPSSAAVYGAGHPEPISEDAAPAPISVYGLHKRLAEEICLGAATQWGLKLTVVRFFSLYGAGLQKQIFWDLWNKISRGGRIVLSGTGNETRDFLHVCDAARLLLHVERLAGTGTEPFLVNGGTGRATTIREAALTLENVSSTDAEIVFDGEPRSGDPPHLVASVERLAATGWHPRVSLRDGLASYADWASQAVGSAPPSSLAVLSARNMEVL